jgi:hypothetical protein
MKNVVELEKASIGKLDTDILITQYKSNSEILEEDAREIDGAHLSMAEGDDMFVIVDMTAENTKIKKTAEEYFIRKAKMVPFTKALAMVKENRRIRLSRVRGKRLTFPYKEFKTREDAEFWINTLKN